LLAVIADDLNLDWLAKNASDSSKKALRLVCRGASAKIALGATGFEPRVALELLPYPASV
jgi:hypothetical protein